MDHRAKFPAKNRRGQDRTARRRSQRAGHFAQVWRVVGIKTAPARRRLDRRIGREQHGDGIADRMIVADPRQGAGRPSGRKHRLARLAQVAHQLVHRRGRFVILTQEQDRRRRRDGGARPMPQFGGAIAECGEPQNLGDLQRNLARGAEPISDRVRP